MSVPRITKWLREHGESHDHGAAFTYEVQDEPWMEFSAELQDWSQTRDGLEILFFGYHFVQNGDICYDPQLKVELQDGVVHHISYLNWMAGAHDATDDPYAVEFADLVWKRHLQDRTKTDDINPSTTMNDT